MARTYRRDGGGRFAGGSGSSGGSRAVSKGGRKGVSAPSRPSGKKQTTLRASSGSKKRGSGIQRFVKKHPAAVNAAGRVALAVGVSAVVGGAGAARSNQLMKRDTQAKTALRNLVSDARGISNGRSPVRMARKTGVIQRRYKITTV